MKELSIFVDESGDFGLKDKHSKYYIITMVFHNQNVDIANQILQLEKNLHNLNCTESAVHTEPLIRREYPYQHLSPNERRSIFVKLYYFAIKSEISYKTFIFKKLKFDDIFELQAQMAKEISLFLKENLTYFQKFDNIILYYDNGQHELNRILNTVLATELSSYEVRKVSPSKYILFQVADLICTLKLLEVKYESGYEMTRSEKLLFHSKREIKKDFFKRINKKEFGSKI